MVTSRRLRGIEGLRALAVLSVLTFHVWQQGAPGGRSVVLGEFSKFFDMLSIGVALFFVLSGFLLFRPYAAAAARGLPTPSLRAYLRNRLLRIGPAYLAIVLVVIVLLQHAIRDNFDRFVANVFLVQYYVPGYVAPDLHQGNGGIAIVPSWSLAVEVVFYLLLPLLGLTAIRAARRIANPMIASLSPVAVMVLLGVAAKIVSRFLAPGGIERVWNFAFLIHADWFAWGMTVAVLRVAWEDGRLRLPSHWRLSAIAAGIALALAGTKLYYSGVLDRVEAQSVMAISCALLLALVVLDPRESIPLRILCSKPIVAIGLVSYSVFLWQDPLLRELRDNGFTEAGSPGFALNLAVVSIVTALAATGTYVLVEKRALARKQVGQQPPDTGGPTPNSVYPG